MASLWRESGLNWTDFLPEAEDVHAFLSQQVGGEVIPLPLIPFPRQTNSSAFVNATRSCSSCLRTPLAPMLLPQKGSCPPRTSASSWRSSCWRRWPVTSRFSTGSRYDRTRVHPAEGWELTSDIRSYFSSPVLTAQAAPDGVFRRVRVGCCSLPNLSFNVQANLDDSQMSSAPFLRALMTAVCKAAVKGWRSLARSQPRQR